LYFVQTVAYRDKLSDDNVRFSCAASVMTTDFLAVTFQEVSDTGQSVHDDSLSPESLERGVY
jgi:hypothetical protein